MSLSLQEILNTGDVSALAALLQSDPAVATRQFTWATPCKIGPGLALRYLAQARFWGYAKHGRSGEMARLLLEAGCPVDGASSDAESLLITAVSYHEHDVAFALIEAGADLEKKGYEVPGGTALDHAVKFGAVAIAEKLVSAGAEVRSVFIAAGVGLERDWSGLAPGDRMQALLAAAICGRLGVIDALLGIGVDLNQFVDGATVLHWAAWEANAQSVRHLLARGANANLRDETYQLTALGWARHRASQLAEARPDSHQEVMDCLSASTVK
jgi:ankyrin repeat protein